MQLHLRQNAVWMVLGLFWAWTGVGLELVRDGKPVAAIVLQRPAAPEGGRRGRRRKSGDEQAAATLISWIGKITDATLPVVSSPPADGGAVYVGKAAVDAGLSLKDVAAPYGQALRVVCDGRRVLLAGQDDASTLKAACRLLEELGCRYFIDHSLGEVYPRTTTLSVGELDIGESPKTAYRRIWGSQWSGDTVWKVWNGHGGWPLSTGHSWGKYVDKKAFAEHPEWFALRNGERRQGDWYCTSNPGVREAFTAGVLTAIRGGSEHPSLSPPDGRGYCECDACRAQDDPNSVEPSTGTVCVSNRYVDFYRHVADKVAAEHPNTILNFYCYADYTQAPTSGIKLPPNLCAWIAPIRYCRFHAVGTEHCPSRRQLEQLLDGWNRAAEKIAYRTYNYNLAECVVPFSKLSVWSHDIPYLKRKGCIGFNLESLRNWEIYGPHMYLSIRLAYDPDADAKAIMDDYFLKFFGPQAGPLMQDYWMRIDRAFAALHCHSGSFFAIHLVYTPACLAELTALLDRAATAAAGDETLAARVAMCRAGLDNAVDYEALRAALNAGKGEEAKVAYDRLIQRSEAEVEKKLGQAYTVRYAERFLGKQVGAAATAVTPPKRVLGVLPDDMALTYDPDDRGSALGYATVDFDDAAWPRVKTYSAPLNAQGLSDRQTILWYRTTFVAPARHGPLSLLFLEVDGTATVYVNGTEVARDARGRQPFEAAIDEVVKAGENALAVRCDHSRISDLDLGGIVRPVYLVETAR